MKIMALSDRNSWLTKRQKSTYSFPLLTLLTFPAMFHFEFLIPGL